MQSKQPISSEMPEITVGHSRTDVSKKNIIWLKSRSGLYWMLAEGVLEYVLDGGLVILEQSGQGSSFSGSCLVSQIDLSCKLLNII